MSAFLARVDRPENPELEVDDYVPVTCTWPGYLRLSDKPSVAMLDSGGCLLELKVNRTSGQVVELVVVDVRQKGLIRESTAIDYPAFEHGTPCFEFQDSGDDFGLVAPRLHSDGLDIALASEEAVRWIGSPHCVMGFSSRGRLARLMIRLDPEDVSQVFN